MLDAELPSPNNLRLNLNQQTGEWNGRGARTQRQTTMQNKDRCINKVYIQHNEIHIMYIYYIYIMYVCVFTCIWMWMHMNDKWKYEIRRRRLNKQRSQNNNKNIPYIYNSGKIQFTVIFTYILVHMEVCAPRLIISLNLRKIVRK